MTEQATISDFICVIWAMPKGAFVLASFRALLSRKKLSVTDE
jgi:hypothetical protein